MATRKSSDIAKMFSKGHECHFLLTKKQAEWLIETFVREDDGINHKCAQGSFENNGKQYYWRCSREHLLYGAAAFKVELLQDANDVVENPEDEFAKSKGYKSFADAVLKLDHKSLCNLVIEFNEYMEKNK